MRKKWLVLLCLLVIGSSLATIWIWSARRSEPTPSLLLPGSNRVYLVAVTVGTNARINFGKPIERVLARLPGKLGARFRVNEISTPSRMYPSDQIILWFRYDRPADQGTYLRASLVNEDGRLPPTTSLHPRTLPNGVAVACSGTDLWPRRNRTLKFRVEQLSQTSHQGVEAGELIVANPAYDDYPVWIPEKLPATRNFKNTSFTLEGFVWPRVRVTSGGRPDTSWQVWSHWLRDATGNLMAETDRPMQAPMRHKADDRGVITVSTFYNHGMPKEAAWKLGLRFVRARHLASNDVFVLRGVPATTTGSWPPTTWKTNLPAGTVELRFQTDWEDGSRKPCVVPNLPTVFNLGDSNQNFLPITILGAVDQLGQKIPVVDGRKILIPSGATTLDVTIAVLPQHFVEYTVDTKAWLSPGSQVQSSSTPDY